MLEATEKKLAGSHPTCFNVAGGTQPHSGRYLHCSGGCPPGPPAISAGGLRHVRQAEVACCCAPPQTDLGKVLAAIAAFGTVAGAVQLAWDLLDQLRHVLAGG